MKVTLISHTTNPLRAICIATSTMKEKNPIEYVNHMSDEEMKNYVREVMKTSLLGPLEFAEFSFLVEGVTRAFTHQLVRHRLGSYSQQSLRFFKVENTSFLFPMVSEKQLKIISKILLDIFKTYELLIADGCPVEKARSILPTNTTTSISFSMNFRSLIEMAGVRLCLQTQDEFRDVMKAIKAEINLVDPFLASLLVPVCVRENVCKFKSIFDRPCQLTPR